MLVTNTIKAVSGATGLQYGGPPPSGGFGADGPDGFAAHAGGPPGGGKTLTSVYPCPQTTLLGSIQLSQNLVNVVVISSVSEGLVPNNSLVQSLCPSTKER